MTPYVTLRRESQDVPKMVGWIGRTAAGAWQTEEQIGRAIHNSMIFALCVRDLGQVGLARVVSDHASFSAITDVFIEEEYRGRGWGRVLMQAVVDHNSVGKTLCVLTTRIPEYYAKFGFVCCGGSWMMRQPK